MAFTVQSRPTAGCGGGFDVRQFDRGVPEDPEGKAGGTGGGEGCGALSRGGHVGTGKCKSILLKLRLIYRVTVQVVSKVVLTQQNKVCVLV